MWLVLSIGSLGYFGYLGYELIQKASRVAKALETPAEQIQNLVTALETTPDLPRFEGNLFDNPAELAAAHARNLKKRELKRQAEQRRLINKLNDYRPDESEFPL
jgi:argininosuccinate lyase